MLGNEKKDYDRQQSRASLLWACARTVGSYAAMYASTTAFMEVFEPVVEVIKGVKVAGAGKWCKKMEVRRHFLFWGKGLIHVAYVVRNSDSLRFFV